jgi:rhomboid family GlyGly-CTERM serine protease
MRLSLNVGLSVVVLAVMSAELLGWSDALEFRRALAATQPWRLLTGHFVLFAERLRPREFFGILAVAPVIISLLFLVALPDLLWYRGLSGVLHALYFAGCVVWIASTSGRARWLPIAALLGGMAKVLLEQPWDSSFPVHEVLRIAVVPQAHLIGAIVGTSAGLILRRVQRTA